MASIRKRNGKWQVRINRDDISVTKTFLNKKDGEIWARITEADIERNDFKSKTKKSKETLGELLDLYNAEVAPHHRSPTTGFMIASLKSKLGGLRIEDFNASVLASWRDNRLREVKPASVIRELNTLSAMLNHARKEWCYEVINFTKDIKRPSGVASRARRLSGDEESKLISVLPAVCADIVSFALETAMRRGEILSIVWHNINFDTRVVLLPLTKNGDERRVPLSNQALEILKRQKALTTQSINGKVFNVNPNSLDKAWRKACKKTGIGQLRFHDLRHEAISRLFEAGLNMMEVSTISGHKTLSMLKRYTHLKAEDIVKKLG